MKFNKKVLIPVCATAMGLSVIGGIAGAVAWYQYNSKVSASFVGASVADTGVLQIGHKETPTSDISWGRDFFADGDAAKLVPVTFGALNADKTLPEKAYAYPQSGCGEGYVGHDYTANEKVDHKIDGWVEAEEGKQYSQFELYFEAFQTDSSKEKGYKLVERDVYLSDFIFKSVEDEKIAEEALRVHLDIEGQEKLLLSKNAHENANKLALFDGLDLDKNGHNDQYHKSLFNDSLRAYGVDDQGNSIHVDGEEVVYGEQDKYQETKALSLFKKDRDSNEKMSPEPEKVILRTRSDRPVKVIVTIWLEGWELLNTGEVDANTNEPVKSNIWNPYYSAGTEVQVGLQFDTGKFREDDLTDQQDPYVLTFLANNGTDDKLETLCQAGSTFTLPGCEFTGPSGKRFDGWVVDGQKKAIGEVITPTSDMEIVAHWGLIPMITFNKGNDAAQGTMDNGSASSILGYELPDCAFTLAKHSFKCWKIGNDEYQPGDIVVFEDDATVTAIWEHDPCTITFALNGSPSTIDPLTVDYESDFDLASIAAEAPEGKQFSYWKVGDDVYDLNSASTTIQITDDTEIEVFWETKVCSITFDFNGGTYTGSEPLDATREYGTSFVLPNANEITAPANTEFDCWEINNVEYAAGESVNIQDDVTVKAIWKNI